MANDVTHPSINNTPTRDPYADYADEVSTRPFAGDLLRFSKHGEYKAGQEQEIVDEGTRMLAHMPSMKRGWVKWGDSQPLAHIMGLVSEGFRPPPRDELGDLDEDQWELLNDRPIDPWQKTNHLTLCDTQGRIYTFVTSSKGGLSAVGQLAEAYSLRRRMKPDEIPVIELQSRSYDHKQYGETFAPVLKIIGWTKIPETFNDLNAAIEDASDETVPLEELMQTSDDQGDYDHEQGDEQEQEEAEQEQEEQEAPPPRQTRQSAPPPRQATPQKPAQRAAPQKAAPQKTAPRKPAPKAPPPRNAGKAGNNGRRSPRV